MAGIVITSTANSVKIVMNDYEDNKLFDYVISGQIPKSSVKFIWRSKDDNGDYISISFVDGDKLNPLRYNYIDNINGVTVSNNEELENEINKIFE